MTEGSSRVRSPMSPPCAQVSRGPAAPEGGELRVSLAEVIDALIYHGPDDRRVHVDVVIDEDISHPSHSV